MTEGERRVAGQSEGQLGWGCSVQARVGTTKGKEKGKFGFEGQHSIFRSSNQGK